MVIRIASVIDEYVQKVRRKGGSGGHTIMKWENFCEDDKNDLLEDDYIQEQVMLCWRFFGWMIDDAVISESGVELWFDC